MNYSAKLDPVVYSPHTRAFTPKDWADLAVAAADQAGLTVEQQRAVRASFTAQRAARPTVDKFVQPQANPPTSQPPTNLVSP